ncbi:MAG: isocitrate lyase/phosphoenolpyruvate mutase family protein [Colwellia sp.]|nr:isocitrate lyase/phosphoenolpyruvate mutase family protein [Colwellia sp.]
MNFKQLHQQNKPLLICNVWDAASAKIAKKLNFDAIGTSSAAIAEMLGYQDGEQMSFSELLFIVKRIIATTTLPITVDIEAGYSRNPAEITEHIIALADLGIAGINIEDSIITNERELMDAKQFANTLSAVTQQLAAAKKDIFINVRTDTFLLAHDTALEETIKRIALYEAAGADGIFVPCITKEADISAVVSQTTLPINVMCMPDLPNIIELQKLNVKRISMGNFIFDNLSNHFESTLCSVIESQSFQPVFYSR